MVQGRAGVQGLAGVYERREPAGEGVPVVFDLPRAGVEVPDDFASLVDPTELQALTDRHLEGLFDCAPQYGAVLVQALFAPFYVDLDQPVNRADPELIDGSWVGGYLPFRKSGKGLFRGRTHRGTPLYDRKLRADALDLRLSNYYHPYMDAMKALLDQLHRKFGAVWHINCQAQAWVGDPISPDRGQRWADFVLDDQDGGACHPDFTLFVSDCLKARGYSVALNRSRGGGELGKRFGGPKYRRHSLRLAVARDLFTDLASDERHRSYGKLQANLTELVLDICREAEKWAAAPPPPPHVPRPGRR